MRITDICVLLCCLAGTSLAADEHRPKKKDDRSKRNLEYQISHHYSGLPNYRLERRISTGSPYPPQYYPRPYRKGRPQSYPIPPYAVQMEPLVHYSQRDPLYDTNILSLDTHNDDLLTENNHIQEDADRRGYIHVKPRVIERPVYIKEPEPIIEIIIKESNVTLPGPPPPPPSPKKKKEQVQVFFVKYKKNPHGVGKDSIIYEKPVPALSPKLPEDEEEEIEEAPYNYHAEAVTAPPPPSTTLRTIIRPESETYHSPSGVKVTFGKEGFDYEKRSSKPEDYVPPQSQQAPQGRQLTSFSNAYFKPPLSNPNFQSSPPGFQSSPPGFQSSPPGFQSSPPGFQSSPSGFRPDSRPRQSFRPVSFPPSQSFKQFGRQTPPQYPQQPKFQAPPYVKPSSEFNSFPHQQQPLLPQQFSHTISHPPPSRFQTPRPTPQTRQPVPYQPFEKFRPQQEFPQPNHVNPPHQQQQIQFRPETQFPTHQQLPLSQQSHTFTSQRHRQEVPQFTRPELPQRPPQQSFQQQHFENHQQGNILRQQSTHHQQNVQSHPQINFQNPPQINQQHQKQNIQPIPHPIPNPVPPPQNFHQQEHRFSHQQSNPQQPPISQEGHFHAGQNIVPPGGELIQSIPKYEQHLSSVETANNQPSQSLSPQQYQQKVIEQFNSQEQVSHDSLSHQQNTLEQQRRFLGEQQRQNQQQEQLRQYYLQQQEGRQRNENREVVITSPSPSTIYHVTRKAQIFNTTPRIFQSTTSRPSTTTTATEAPTPSTTTKDPKILEAQLPDEVPEELRAQLLSSGILNNADISVLDYDKVGDIPLSALPPEQLANFYNAGGAAQIGSGSHPVPSIVDNNGTPIADRLVTDEEDVEQEAEASEIQEVKVSPPDPQANPHIPPSSVDLKVVHYNPETDKGQQVQESYIQGEDAKQVSPVVLNDDTYTRYLPLKVNGSQFPIPDVPELKGKKISSVVVLAPVTYDFSSERKTRETSKKAGDIEFIEGETLKKLLNDPSLDNYKTFLENENKTKSDKQAVILLVTDHFDPTSKDKEIFMYDVGTKTVSRLSGELSSAFVEAAEANSNDETPPPEGVAVAASSNIVETRVPYSRDENIDRHGTVIEKDLEDSASDFVESKIPIIDPMQDEDMETEASEQLESFVDISGHPLGDLSVSASEIGTNSVENLLVVNAGHSNIRNN